MLSRLLGLFVAVGILGLGGCANVPKGLGFGDVEREVARRTGQRVHWNRGSASDQAVAATVRSMLANELGADEAVQIALLNNRNLQATYEELGVAQAEVVQAGLLRNPIFDAEIKFVERGGGTGLELAVVQDFLDVFFIPLRKRIAENAFEAAKLRVTGAVLDLVGQVRTGYFAYAAAEQTLELRQSVVTATEASYDLATRLRAAGNITELDLANERALYEQAKLDLARAETNVLDTRERLNVLLGLWGERVSWTGAKRLPDPPAGEIATDDIERHAVEASLELAAARREVEAAGRTLGLQRTFALLPEAEAGVSAEREPEGEWAVGPAFSLPIPLFDQGQAATLAARSDFQRARQQYAAAAVEVRSAARAARNRLLADRARVNYYRQVVLPLRREITQRTQLQYNAMQLSPFQLLLAKQAEIDAGAAYVEALRDYWITRSQLEQVRRGRLPEMGQMRSEMNASGSSGRGRNAGGH